MKKYAINYNRVFPDHRVPVDYHFNRQLMKGPSTYFRLVKDGFNATAARHFHVILSLASMFAFTAATFWIFYNHDSANTHIGKRDMPGYKYFPSDQDIQFCRIEVAMELMTPFYISLKTRKEESEIYHGNNDISSSNHSIIYLTNPYQSSFSQYLLSLHLFPKSSYFCVNGLYTLGIYRLPQRILQDCSPNIMKQSLDLKASKQLRGYSVGIALVTIEDCWGELYISSIYFQGNYIFQSKYMSRFKTTILLFLITFAWTLQLQQHDTELTQDHEITEHEIQMEDEANVHEHHKHPEIKKLSSQILEALQDSEDSFLEAIQLEQSALVHQTSFSRILAVYNKLKIGSFFHPKEKPEIKQKLKVLENQMKKEQTEALKFKKEAEKQTKEGLQQQEKAVQLEKQLEKLIKKAHEKKQGHQHQNGGKGSHHSGQLHHVQNQAEVIHALLG